MDFALNDDQAELKRQARAWLTERYPLDRDWDGAQDDRWTEIAELGWLDVAEADLGFVEEALLLEEMGYACYPGPFLAHVMALPSLGADDRAAAAAGAVRWSVEVRSLTPWLGSVDRVVDADGNAQDARGEELVSVDPSRPLGRLERTNGTPLPGARDIPRARAAMAAEALGVAQRALELGVEHVKTREQFGKPIGVYQAVSHQLADTYADVELARSLVYWAAWCVQDDEQAASGQAAVAAAAAKAFAAEAAVAACERSIQVHGGTGFTWEHPLHRFYKRALWLEGFGSRPSELRGEVADAVLGVTVGV
jgi:alkylation response protein AidB-like acyl-CoA dehydrogenase